MALTGLQIYKQLPKTNCGDCNFPTCMAFAMQLAAKRISLDLCPHISEEGKKALSAASAPPMRLITVGKGEKALKIGQETVLFRHQEKFHHPAGIAIKIKDSLPNEEIEKTIEEINKLKFVRVGEEIGIDLIALENLSGEASRYREVTEVLGKKSTLPLVLLSPNPEVMKAALEVCGQDNPLIYAANSENYQQMANLAKNYRCPLVVQADTLENLADLTEKVKNLGVEDLVLDAGAPAPARALDTLTSLRRLVLEKNFRSLGYPVAISVKADDPYQEIIQASTYMCKYAGIIIIESREPWQLLPLLTVRQNIYTDPQVPNAVEPKLYEIGAVNPSSPVLVSTNFSLSYFTVESEVENSKIPSYISVVETEGLGVLNAYAGDKWSAEKIGKTLEVQKVKEKISHNKLIIPGLVAVFRAELMEDFGWDVLVGPEEAARIPSFLKNKWKV